MNQYHLREKLEHGDQARPWQLYRLPAIQGSVFPCHWHPEWELLIVEKGSFQLTRNQTSLGMQAGEVALLTGMDLHGGTSQDPELVVHAFVFHPWILRSTHHDAATEAWLGPLEAGSMAVRDILPALSPAALLAEKIVAALRQADKGMELAIKGLLLQFLAELVGSGLVQPSLQPYAADPIPQIRATLQLMEERFHQPLTVEILAAAAGLSPAYFARLFKAITGDSPINHLISRRIDAAAQLLRQGQVSVTEAAFRVGYTNLSLFTRSFRARWGVNPSKMQRLGPKAS